MSIEFYTIYHIFIIMFLLQVKSKMRRICHKTLDSISATTVKEPRLEIDNDFENQR